VVFAREKPSNFREKPVIFKEKPVIFRESGHLQASIVSLCGKIPC